MDFPPELTDHPRYRVERFLGRGGMGAVYQARHRQMDRKVALKVIRPHLLQHDAAVTRFRQEVKLAGKLDHPNIVRAHDADQAGTLYFLVMEYVEGTDLAHYLKQHGPLPVAEACDLILQAARGLQHAHEQGLVHRDVKPSNLLRTPAGQIKVLDFGLARLVRVEDGPAGTEATGQGVVLGTPDYIAPEQTYDSRRADARSDVYSLGCTLVG